MNRVIKFRAWDKENKKMIYDFANFSSGNVIDVPEGRWSHELRLTNKNEIKASLNFKSNNTFETKRFEYIPTMQFTGLKDKNGVDIYEGDIVECFNDGLSEVLFRKGSFGTLTYTSRGVDFYTFNEIYGACEIIGNIYENPELLEVES